MKEIAQQILRGPFNWTGLTLKELVNADRIPRDQLGKIFKALAIDFLNKKYNGVYDGAIKDYLFEKENLEAELEFEFFGNN